MTTAKAQREELLEAIDSENLVITTPNNKGSEHHSKMYIKAQ